MNLLSAAADLAWCDEHSGVVTLIHVAMAWLRRFEMHHVGGYLCYDAAAPMTGGINHPSRRHRGVTK